MKIVKLPKVNLGRFINHLGSFGEIHALVRRVDESFTLAPMTDLTAIALDCTRTIVLLNKHFFKPTDVMFNFSSEEDFNIQAEYAGKKLIIFGARPCDIYGLKIFGVVMGGRYADNYHFDKTWRLTEADVVTPTAQNLTNIEKDLRACAESSINESKESIFSNRNGRSSLRSVHVLCGPSAGGKLQMNVFTLKRKGVSLWSRTLPWKEEISHST